MVTFIVLQRAFTPVAHEYLSVDRRIDISATEIRNRIASDQLDSVSRSALGRTKSSARADSIGR